MADIKITDLTAVTTLAVADQMEVEQGGVSKRSTIQKILDLILATASTWTAKQTLNGYTVLGDSGPSIKTKKLTGTTSNVQGGYSDISHGLTTAKIISVNVLVDSTTSLRVPPEYTANAGYQYSVHMESTIVRVTNSAANSVNILSAAITVLVVYEE